MVQGSLKVNTYLYCNTFEIKDGNILLHYICNVHFHWLRHKKICGIKIIAIMP